jgi:hypothetical protein
MLLCEMGSDASFRYIGLHDLVDLGIQKTGTSSKPPNLSSSYCTFVYCDKSGVLARVKCGCGFCEEAGRVQEAIKTTKVDSPPLQVPQPIYG